MSAMRGFLVYISFTPELGLAFSVLSWAPVWAPRLWLFVLLAHLSERSPIGRARSFSVLRELLSSLASLEPLWTVEIHSAAQTSSPRPGCATGRGRGTSLLSSWVVERLLLRWVVAWGSRVSEEMELLISFHIEFAPHVITYLRINIVFRRNYMVLRSRHQDVTASFVGTVRFLRWKVNDQLTVPTTKCTLGRGKSLFPSILCNTTHFIKMHMKRLRQFGCWRWKWSNSWHRTILNVVKEIGANKRAK